MDTLPFDRDQATVLKEALASTTHRIHIAYYKYTAKGHLLSCHLSWPDADQKSSKEPVYSACRALVAWASRAP
jgi:hypothetical protein